MILSLAGHFKLFAGHLIEFNYSSSPDISKIRWTCPASPVNFAYSACGGRILPRDKATKSIQNYRVMHYSVKKCTKHTFIRMQTVWETFVKRILHYSVKLLKNVWMAFTEELYPTRYNGKNSCNFWFCPLTVWKNNNCTYPYSDWHWINATRRCSLELSWTTDANMQYNSG